MRSALRDWTKRIKAFFGNDEEALNEKEREFLPAALEVIESPPSLVSRVITYTMFALIALGVLWVWFGKVDEVAVAFGKVIPVGQVKTLQAEDKAVVKNIYVKEGQSVQAGDLLIELDSTVSAADLARFRKEVAYYSLEIERLLSERDGTPFLASNPENDPHDVDFQFRLQQSRETEYLAKRTGAESAVRESEANLRSARILLEKIKEQLEWAQKKEQLYERLVKEGGFSAVQLMDQSARRMEMERNVATQISDIVKAEAVLAQNREKLSAIMVERVRDIATKLVEDRKLLQTAVEEVKKAQEKNRLSRIVAPVSGKVNQLSVFTLGGVVTPAQVLMVIVPDGTVLEVEAWAANKDVGFLKIGQQAAVKIETFNFQKYGTLDAEVVELSGDAKEDKEKGTLLYRIALRLKKDKVLVDSVYIPVSTGMAAVAEIKIKEKRIIEFFLDPFRRFQDEALRER